MKTSFLKLSPNKKTNLNSEFWLPLPKSLVFIFLIYFAFLNPASSKMGDMKTLSSETENIPTTPKLLKQHPTKVNRKISSKNIRSSCEEVMEQDSIVKGENLDIKPSYKERNKPQTYCNPLMAEIEIVK